MRVLKQSTAYDFKVFMTLSSDHVTGATGLTLTVTAAKANAAFASIAPAVTERGNGWYDLALTAAHTDTVGDLALHVTAAGADPADPLCQVRANVLGDTLPANATQWAGTVVPAPAVAGVPKVDVTDVLGSAVTSAGTVDANVVSYAAGEDPLALVLDGADGVEAGKTVRQALRALLAALAAKASGAGTSAIVFRDVNDTKNRITATVDALGNRTAVVLDLT